MFSFLLTVHAESLSGTILNDDVRLRSGAGTNTNILATMNKNSKVEVLDSTAKKGTGCSNGWYQIKYNTMTGYVCGQYLSIEGQKPKYSYSRPWSSPKKAIYGGAEFIADGYISAGQSTSYLKKFNVNPNSYYSVYTHQYMANLAAPNNEAYSTYKSYKDNNLLSLPLHFTIPIFENMPQKTSHPVTGEERGGQTTVKDKAFEEELNKQGFNETYKVWLRALHEIHSNWTFESLKTGLDFNTAVANEKYSSSVYYSCTACREVPNYETEKNWYIANNQTVSYFLDPRNFLDETSILMFEELSFSKYYTEEAVSSVLKGTFMDGLDPIDNQSYSSIFYEAGKTYDVSPIYLASLSKQEVGARGSITTSGEQFEYNGITYIGFYNFFNIGAYSSEANPAKAGLVYASLGSEKNERGIYVGNVGGTPEISPGVPTEQDTPQNQPAQQEEKTDPKQEETPTQPIDNNGSTTASQLSQLSLNQKNNYVTNFSLGTTASTLLSKNKNITIKDAKGNVLTSSTKIGTGSTITFASGETLTAVLYGDLDGDGQIDALDLLAMVRALNGKYTLKDSYLEAAHLYNVNTKIDAMDLLSLVRYLNGKLKINQS